MPKLTVKFYGTLQKSLDQHDAEKGVTITVPKGTTVAGLIRILNLDARQIGMVTFNGRTVASDQTLDTGGELKVFQPISGG